MVCSSILLYVLRCRNIISFRINSENQSTKNIPGIFIPLDTLITTLPLAISYLLYMLVSMESVRGVSVPMYTTLRRTTVAFTMLMEYVLVRQKYTRYVIGSLLIKEDDFSVGIIILGAFIAGARDLSFDSYAYAIVFSANFCTAIYLASISRIGKSSGLNSFGLMWCKCLDNFVGLICTPVLLLWTWICGDLEVTKNFPHLSSPGFQVVMLLSCVMAFLLNYAVFLNTTLNSALTQTICGNLKDLFTIGLGWIVFGGLPFDLLNILRFYSKSLNHSYNPFHYRCLPSPTTRFILGVYHVLMCLPSPTTRFILGVYHVLMHEDKRDMAYLLNHFPSSYCS
ncbi:sugar phosphate transporter domain-containing protein [Artemisia annua]|uniref:Sugar phosphate transporter domain-containing protein n=1 Tax=Artemisia annua TaxID=35608 RepID=A0A2U1LRV7_ARTAN|nr:sugar phosphate transporter domain-containing protein [Artemisia annua]